MPRFMRFLLISGVKIVVFDDGLVNLDGSPYESRLNKESLQSRIANLKKYSVDTSVEETVLGELDVH